MLTLLVNVEGARFDLAGVRFDFKSIQFEVKVIHVNRSSHRRAIFLQVWKSLLQEIRHNFS